jgi:FtsZ-interacting cell division protein ZipA
MTSLLRQVADKISAGEDKRASGSWLSWILGALLAIVGLAVGAFVLWRHSGELARLRHEKVVRETEEREHRDAAAVAASDAEVTALRAEADAAKARAEQAGRDLAAAGDQYARDRRAVDRIRSWRDVDPGAR